MHLNGVSDFIENGGFVKRNVSKTDFYKLGCGPANEKTTNNDTANSTVELKVLLSDIWRGTMKFGWLVVALAVFHHRKPSLQTNVAVKR